MEKLYQIGEEKKEGHYQYEMTIPGSSIANVILSLNQYQKIEIKRKHGNIESKKIEGLQTGRFKLSGENTSLQFRKKINTFSWVNR